MEYVGHYEPLVVRRLAQEPGRYQVIHGHNRLRALRAMGHAKAKCLIWDIDDDRARVYLAAVNRMSGCDIPERRTMLLEQLLEQMPVDDLAELLPDKKRVLEELLELSILDHAGLQRITEENAGNRTAQVAISCRVDERGARSVNLALDLIIGEAGGRMSRGKAMAELARRFLGHCLAGQAPAAIDADAA
jgi:ParB-like chromosome segregation protein Spo0J